MYCTPWVSYPSNDWYFKESDTIAKMVGHMHGDTISFPASSNVGIVVLSQDSKQVQFASGGYSHQVNGGGEQYGENEDYEIINLPLVTFSPGVILFGVRGPQAQANLELAYFEGSYSIRNGVYSCSSSYVGTDWNSKSVNPIIAVTFAK
jgi:hypothetical protein